MFYLRFEQKVFCIEVFIHEHFSFSFYSSSYLAALYHASICISSSNKSLFKFSLKNEIFFVYIFLLNSQKTLLPLLFSGFFLSNLLLRNQIALPLREEI